MCVLTQPPRRIALGLDVGVVFLQEFDLEAEEYVPLPKGEVHKKKEVCVTARRWVPSVFILFSRCLCVVGS